MVRTQIQLTEAQYQSLKELAHGTGHSLSEWVRRAVDELLKRDLAKRERARALIGAFRADRDDVAERHDHYFVEAIES